MQRRAYTLRAQQQNQRQEKESFAPVRRTQPKSAENIRLDEVLKKEFVIDNAIKSQFVQIKQFSLDLNRTVLGDPIALQEAFRDVDRETSVLRQISKTDDPNKPAIVEICSRKGLLEEMKKKEERAADLKKNARMSKPKQVELNWAIGGHDLDIKMKQLADFVEKGKKVEILLASRKRQRKATAEEAQVLHKKIKDTLAEIGAKEIKPMEGVVGGQAMLTVQRPKVKGEKVEGGDG